MKDNDNDLAERAFRRRRRQDAALVLPIFGIVMLMTPVLQLFSRDILIFGAPLPFVYVFGMWILLIILANRLSRRLSKGDEGT